MKLPPMSTALISSSLLAPHRVWESGWRTNSLAVLVVTEPTSVPFMVSVA